MKKYYSIILIWVFLISNKSFACICPLIPLKQLQQMEYENSECIFIANVTDFNKTNGTFKFEIIESFKGEIDNKKFNGKFPRTCSPYIDEKGKWLLYGNFNSNTIFEINTCGISRSFAHPENSLATKLPSPPPQNKTITEKEQNEKFEKRIAKLKRKAHSDLKKEIENLRHKQK